MRRLQRCRLEVVTAVIIATLACGGGSRSSVTGPSALGVLPPARTPTVVSFRSGDTDQPAAGAFAVLQGQTTGGPVNRTYTADAAGQITIEEDVLLSPVPQIEITAPRFLTRSTLLRSGETVLSLWPTGSATGLDEDLTSTLVYSPSTCPAQSTGTIGLIRLMSSITEARVSFTESLSDERAQIAHERAIARLNAMLGGSPRFTFAPGVPAGHGVFTVEINPDHATCTAGPEPLRAAANVTLTSGQITGGRLTFCTVEAARSERLVLHELGHAIGLRHSPSTSDVMYCTTGRPLDFSARERLTVSLMKQRRAGNRWPDNDRQAVAPLAGRVIEQVSTCGDRPSRER